MIREETYRSIIYGWCENCKMWVMNVDNQHSQHIVDFSKQPTKEDIDKQIGIIK